MAVYGTTSTYGLTSTYGVNDTSGGDAVTLAEFRDYVGEQRLSAAAQLQSCLDAAIDAVERYTFRRWSTATVTETHSPRPGTTALALRAYPPLDVTDVVEAGATVIGTVLDETTGLLHRDGSGSATWYPGPSKVTVTYTAGAITVPASVKEAILMTARSVWGEHSGGSQRRTDEFAEPADLIPRVARLMLQPYRMPGFGN